MKKKTKKHTRFQCQRAQEEKLERAEKRPKEAIKGSK
jgi:hypothetical protein